MTSPVADRAVLDTNVLLAATDEGRPEHAGAVAALNAWPASGMVLYTSGQILREYLAVATRPIQLAGLGLARADALTNARALRAHLTLLAEDARVSERLLQLVGEVECAGKQVHDANVVATMLVHGIESLVTMNLSDFARFEGHVRVLGLPTAA
ncbi:MAG: PIN domain-containing protein [Candidatus Dormibacteraeota bacterium]|nr:PIN domain-containing protein [Candidatus Dormibacteraeota bacterium]